MPNHNHKSLVLSKQQGFTLIELMIAITLGLLISAAALMIFLSSQRSLAIQSGMGEIQQNAIFGLRNLTYDLRHINLDTSNNGRVTKDGLGSGIVFKESQVDAPSITLTPDQVTTANKDKSIMDTKSDQLTIQFKARTKNMTDCEGIQIPTDTIIVQRYYINELPSEQQPSNVTPETKRYGLYCDAIGNPNTTTPNNKGVPVILDAESFKISLGVRDLKGTVSNRNDDLIRYEALSDYITNPTGDLITSLEIGVVLRSSNSVHKDKNIDTNQKFTIAGQDVKLNIPATSTNYLRVPLSQVVAIRNSQGVE